MLSYAASAALVATMIFGVVFNASLAYGVFIAPFMIDAVIGFAQIRRTHKTSSTGFVMPPKEFVFQNSTFETI